jgi:type 1 glutamine amidotransferase
VRALFVHGGWDGHQPKETTELFAGILDGAGSDVTMTDDLAVLADGAALGAYDLVVPVVTMGELTGEQEQGLCAAVRAGTGIGGWHGGMVDAFRASTTYQFMVGGQFVAHPGGFVSYDVEIVSAHEVVSGIGRFSVTTEQYYLHVDPAIEVHATTEFTGEHVEEIAGVVMPVVWTRRFGAGRVFHCALGHHLPDFDVPETREIVRRGLLWAAR